MIGYTAQVCCDYRGLTTLCRMIGSPTCATFSENGDLHRRLNNNNINTYVSRPFYPGQPGWAGTRKKHSLAPYLCRHCAVSVINFLHLLQSIAYSCSFSCLVWQSLPQPLLLVFIGKNKQETKTVSTHWQNISFYFVRAKFCPSHCLWFLILIYAWKTE